MSSAALSLVPSTLTGRLAAIDWKQVAASLDADGYAVTAPLLTQAEFDALVALYPRDDAFRSRVVMARHGFGLGEYKYFSYPLPVLVSALREELYGPLVGIANAWHEAMRLDVRFPDDHAAFLRRCHRAGQRRPTPLLLQYGAGDYNCLHQDLYGEHVFPLQGRRGTYRVKMRHGVSRLQLGHRHTLGIIFHDATRVAKSISLAGCRSEVARIVARWAVPCYSIA